MNRHNLIFEYPWLDLCQICTICPIPSQLCLYQPAPFLPRPCSVCGRGSLLWHSLRAGGYITPFAIHRCQRESAKDSNTVVPQRFGDGIRGCGSFQSAAHKHLMASSNRFGEAVMNDPSCILNPESTACYIR